MTVTAMPPSRRITILELRTVTGSGGGPEKTILQSARLADTSRFNVVLAYIRNIRDPAFTVARRADELGVRFHDMPERGALDPTTPARLISLIRSEKVDIVHAHDYKSNLLAVLLRPFLRYKLVSTTHGWVTKSPKLEFYYFLDKKALRHCDKIMCVSKDQREELLCQGVASDKIIYLHNGVDTQWFRRRPDGGQLRRELGVGPDHLLVGGIGRLSEEKDFGTFLRVARQVVDQVPGAVFVLVGEGPSRRELERISGELGLDGKVLFLGQRDEILDVYQSLDLFLLTSVREGLPNVVLEAMAMELPIVATNVGGVGEAVKHGETGLLCPDRDVDGLSRAVISVLRDQTYARRLAAAARDTVCALFSFAERVRALERVYLEVMGNSGTSAMSSAIPTSAS